MATSRAAGAGGATAAAPTAAPNDLRALDARHHFHPFTDHRALEAKGGPRVIVRAEGVHLWDADGRRYIDAMAGLWCVNVGYGRRELAEAAARQMAELPYYNTFFHTTHPPAAELGRVLAEVAPPGFSRVFFTSSGSEANDTVIRMVRRYFDVIGKPERQVILARDNAYHGSTMGAASLGGMKTMHRQGGLPIPGIEHVMEPYWYKLGGDRSPEEFGLAAARAVEERILALGPERVAAFIAEPIQGAGGVIVPPDTYWPEVARICREHGVLLVADEVICGFGRTGPWFGSEHYGLDPDLMPIAKGLSSGYLPIGGVMAHDRIAGPLLERGGEFFHGFTSSGHPVACAVALENLRILRAEGIVERCREHTAPYFQARVRELAGHPLVGEVRGAGMLAAIQLAEDPAARKRFEPEGEVGALCRERSFANGLVMRSVAESMVLSPPLVISRAEIDEVVEKARLALDETMEAIARPKVRPNARPGRPDGPAAAAVAAAATVADAGAPGGARG